MPTIYYFDKDRFLNDFKNHNNDVLANPISPFNREYSYYFSPAEKNIKILNKLIIDDVCTYDIIEDDALWIECLHTWCASSGSIVRNNLTNPKIFSIRSVILRDRIIKDLVSKPSYGINSIVDWSDDKFKPLMNIIKAIERNEKLNKIGI